MILSYKTKWHIKIHYYRIERKKCHTLVFHLTLFIYSNERKQYYFFFIFLFEIFSVSLFSLYIRYFCPSTYIIIFIKKMKEAKKKRWKKGKIANIEEKVKKKKNTLKHE